MTTPAKRCPKCRGQVIWLRDWYRCLGTCLQLFTESEFNALPERGEKITSVVADDWETECPRSNDKQHCDCWYDGKPCCRCGEAMNFGTAIKAMQDSNDTHVRRSGWNGKGMFLFYVTPGEWTLTNGHADNYPLLPFIAMKTADDKVVPWLASQTDILAQDWEIAD